MQAVRGAAWQAGEPYEVEMRLRRKDGTYRWHLDRAVPHRDEAGVITKWYGVSSTSRTASGQSRR